MSCPVKYREIGDFHAYYSGTTKAPYLTIFVGGNHEASSHLWELFYGGWVAPNIYYMGAANVIRLGGVRIAGMSGIWKGYNFNKPHYERLPYSSDDVKSIYHVREIDTRKLLQLRTQVDVCISHDWPRAIEKDGDQQALFRMKPDFEQESQDGSLGNQAALYVMDRLRPPYWFSAHMHCKFAATKIYDNLQTQEDIPPSTVTLSTAIVANGRQVGITGPPEPSNSDEIDLDMDDEGDELLAPIVTNGTSAPKNQDEIILDDDDDDEPVSAPPATSGFSDVRAKKPATFSQPATSVSSEIRAQLPAAFSQTAVPSRRNQPGQPTPPDIRNKVVRFLALDKCLPGRKFLQLLEVHSSSSIAVSTVTASLSSESSKPKFEYDPEWLAITRVFASHIVLGNKQAHTPRDMGESHYLPLIEKEEQWVEENIIKKGKLEIPYDFELTAPVFHEGMPEITNDGPLEYSNPQMQRFCDLINIENIFHSSQEEREERIRNGPPLVEERHDGGLGGRRRGGRGRGDGRGGGRGRGRGGGRGRGRGW
jgi:lariat debranching enzyme